MIHGYANKFKICKIAWYYTHEIKYKNKLVNYKQRARLKKIFKNLSGMQRGIVPPTPPMIEQGGCTLRTSNITAILAHQIGLMPECIPCKTHSGGTPVASKMLNPPRKSSCLSAWNVHWVRW